MFEPDCMQLIVNHNFHFQLFDIAVTLTCDQGHWKWYEKIKLYKFYHRAKFGIYPIYSVQENGKIKVFCHTQSFDA